MKRYPSAQGTGLPNGKRTAELSYGITPQMLISPVNNTYHLLHARLLWVVQHPYGRHYHPHREGADSLMPGVKDHAYYPS